MSSELSGRFDKIVADQAQLKSLVYEQTMKIIILAEGVTDSAEKGDTKALKLAMSAICSHAEYLRGFVS